MLKIKGVGVMLIKITENAYTAGELIKSVEYEHGGITVQLADLGGSVMCIPNKSRRAYNTFVRRINRQLKERRA